MEDKQNTKVNTAPLHPLLVLQTCVSSGLRPAPFLGLYWAYTETHLFWSLFCPCLPFFVKSLISTLSWDLNPGWEVVFSRSWALSLLHGPRKGRHWHVLTRAQHSRPILPMMRVYSTNIYQGSWPTSGVEAHLKLPDTRLELGSSSSSSVSLTLSYPCFPTTLIGTESWSNNTCLPWSPAHGYLVGSPNPDGLHKWNWESWVFWTARNLNLSAPGPALKAKLVLLKLSPTLVKGISTETWVSHLHVDTIFWVSFLCHQCIPKLLQAHRYWKGIKRPMKQR